MFPQVTYILRDTKISELQLGLSTRWSKLFLSRFLRIVRNAL